MVDIKNHSMVDSHYKSLTKNKTDVKFIEKLVGKKIETIKSLLEQEEDLDLLLNYNSKFRVTRVPKNISRKLFSKYLVMHFVKNDKISPKDKSYLAKIIAFYWQKDKIADLEKKVFHTMVPTDEQSARIHLALFCLKKDSYKDITGFSNKEAIKKISNAFLKNQKTKSIGENLYYILSDIRILRRDVLFEKLIEKC